MKQIALICIRSIHQEVRLFHAKSHDAVYLGLVKAALVSHPKVQYQLHCCKPPEIFLCEFPKYQPGALSVKCQPLL